eukprot:2861047-Ditylum_brightwellii.AAC.2
MICSSCPLASTLIINVWSKVTPVPHQNLLSQQHLVGLRCVDSMSKRMLLIYLPQIEIDITEDSELGNKWITGITSNAAGKIQPVKVFASQIFHNFNKLTCPYSNLPKNMKGKQIKKLLTMTLSSPAWRRPIARGPSALSNTGVLRSWVAVRQSFQQGPQV